MAKKYTQPEVDPKRYALSRRRFLRNAGIGAASLPFLGSLANTADAAASTPTKNPWPSYPAYKFAFVCHVTADVFFNAVRAGASDMCALLGTSYTWTGSENDIIPEMVNAFKVAITNNVDGIAVAVVDPKAFNAVTDEALGKGIPVVAYNAQAPAGAGSHVLSYIGQDLFQAGVAVGKRILTYVKKGDLVGGMISVPGSLNEQPRMDGAASVFKPAEHRFRPGRRRRHRGARARLDRGLVSRASERQVHVLERWEQRRRRREDDPEAEPGAQGYRRRRL